MKKLFVSSTFKDMQLERDSLKKHIVPNLNLLLREYGTEISQTDLRWGISTTELSAEEGEQKILNVCLDEINKSRPYMIVMLGERYGWIPSPALIDINARGRDINLESNDISVTQLEIEYIAFTEKWDESRIFFYFRDLDTSKMDPTTKEIYSSESAEAKKKLDALKARIERKFPGQIRHYTLEYRNGRVEGIEKFEELVRDDLYSLFKRDLEEDEQTDVNVRVRKKLHREALSRFEFYVQNLDISNNRVKRLTTHKKSDLEKTHLYVSGSPKCGKTMSVSAAYAALYSYQHRDDPHWKIAAPLFEKHDGIFRASGIFSSLPESVNIDKVFPLFLQIGSGKDMKDDVDFLRTFCHYLKSLVGINAPVTCKRRSLIWAITKCLHLLSKGDKIFYLFVDNLSPEALDALFEIEHAFAEEEIPGILNNFRFFISLDNRFEQAPTYLPFNDYCDVSVERTELYFPADYLFAYAKSLGKELSAGVTRHIRGYYGYREDRFENAHSSSFSRPHANLFSTYFMDFTTEDYSAIKLAGNDMNAIEKRQLYLLEQARGDGSDDISKRGLPRLVHLSIEKFEKNHSIESLRALGTIYILSGIAFTMAEAEYIYHTLGIEWEDLEFISYFDDFKEFFVYDREADSYCLLPTFEAILRENFMDMYLDSSEEVTEAVRGLVHAVRCAPFYETKRSQLFHPIILTMNTAFISECIEELSDGYEDEYTLGTVIGKTVGRLLKTFDTDDASRLGKTLYPILLTGASTDTLVGFFDGIGNGFQNHDYEKRILAFANAISDELPLNGETAAIFRTRIALLKAYCYLGWKNDRAIELLYEAEEHLSFTDIATRVKFISILSSLLRKFDTDSPFFEKLSKTIRENISGCDLPDEASDRALLYLGDLYTLSFFNEKFGICADFHPSEELLAPFLSKENFAKMGLYNIETAIYAQSFEELGTYGLTERTRMFMECLASGFPANNYAARLSAMCLGSRLFNIPKNSPTEMQKSLYEKYFYQYQRAIFRSSDGTGYHLANYGVFMDVAFFIHNTVGVTQESDEILWESTEMNNWVYVLDKTREESLDVIIQVCWSYIKYLSLPGFHDMLSTDAANYHTHLAEEGAENPSIRALLFRLTLNLAAVLHNPNSRIMKPKLKKLFKTIEAHYGDYAASLSSRHYKEVKDFIDSL